MERTDVKNNHTEEYSTGQIRCIEKSDPEYPQIMKQYASMPAKLYVKGRLPDPKRRTVAVIGARMCSPYGRMQAFRYAKALSVAGVQIISGMALGIDSEESGQPGTGNRGLQACDYRRSYQRGSQGGSRRPQVDVCRARGTQQVCGIYRHRA